MFPLTGIIMAKLAFIGMVLFEFTYAAPIGPLAHMYHSSVLKFSDHG